LTKRQKSGTVSVMQATTNPDIGAAIRAEMGRQRISMVELAKRVGVSRTTLAYQINGNSLTAKNLIAVAAALDVPMRTLVGDDA